jgi:hypothetical protein
MHPRRMCRLDAWVFALLLIMNPLPYIFLLYFSLFYKQQQQQHVGWLV